jgi:hypothetical protein
MGYSLFWLAVKGKPLADLLAQFELAPTGDTEEIPESDVVSAELSAGWNIIHWNKGDLPTQTQFTTASAGCAAVFCFLEEHVMASFTSGWENGVELWSVDHAAGESNPLRIKGNPPQPFGDIRAKLEAEQKQHNATNPPRRERVDFIFDIPVNLAEAITGYSHNRAIGIFRAWFFTD